MDAFTLTHEIPIRLGFFLGIFGAMALAESLAPRRALTMSKRSRWLANLSLVVVNTIVLRLTLPAAAVGMALYARERGIGLLNDVNLSSWIAFVAAIVMLDLSMYLQHVMFHAVPVLWRLHRVHHADLDVDVTTGARFHPVEVFISMLLKLGVIALIGAPAGAVIAFEVLLNGLAMFNHGNVSIPTTVDRVLRWLVVTPDMHRVHHSTAPDEANSNFGFNLPLWDRLFATYRAEPRGGHRGMILGVADRGELEGGERLGEMLAMPFKSRLRSDVTTHQAA